MCKGGGRASLLRGSPPPLRPAAALPLAGVREAQVAPRPCPPSRRHLPALTARPHPALTAAVASQMADEAVEQGVS